MASPINVEKFKYGVSEVWYAKTYSEYLSSCAAKQAELMSALTEAAAMESLDVLIDGKVLAIDSDVQAIKQDVYDALVEQNIAIDDRISSWESPEFISTYNNLYANDAEFKQKVDTFRSTYEFTGLDLSNLPLYFATNTTDDIIAKDPAVISAIETIANTKISELGINPNTCYTLDDGFIKIKYLFQTYIFHANLNISDAEVPIEATDGQDRSLGNISVNAEDLMETVKTNFASATAWAQGFAALAAENVTEALATFEANVGAIISATNERFAASIATVKSVIASTKANVTSFIDTASEMLGWNKVKDSLFTTVADTDISAYTGASPLGAVNLNSAVGIAEAAGKTLLAVGQGIWEGIKSIGKKLWDKAKPVVMALTDNPVDLAVINNTDLSYTIAGWCFNEKNHETYFAIHNDSDYISQEAVGQKVYQALQGKVGHWVSMDTYFGILMINITSISYPSGYIKLVYDYQFKPKCMNVKSLLEYEVIEYNDYEGRRYLSCQNAVDFWPNYRNWVNAGDMYADDDSDETEKYLGFHVAIMLLGKLFGLCVSDNTGLYSDDKYRWNLVQFTDKNGGVSPYSALGSMWDYTGDLFGNAFDDMFVNWAGDFPTSVTNFDFLQKASGYLKVYGDVDTFKFVPRTQGWAYNYNTGAAVSCAFAPLLAMWIYQQVDKLDNPMDYCFIPYTNGSLDFPDGRYKIKTDAENANIANTIATAITVIVVVVAAILICKAIVKVFKNRRIAKLQTKIGVQDNAMWNNGKVLSFWEQHQYSRRKNKLEKLTGASSGLAGSASSSATLISKVFELGKTTSKHFDIPASVAQGTLVKKQNDNIDDIVEDVTLSKQDIIQLKRLISGHN